MALTETSIIDSINVKPTGHIEVRRADLVLRDGEEIAKAYHRHVLSPGDDLTGQDARVAAIAGATWTPGLIAAQTAAMIAAAQAETATRQAALDAELEKQQQATLDYEAAVAAEIARREALAVQLAEPSP